jgi:TfoX/Sxy family transcriptional regulator of competence genes
MSIASEDLAARIRSLIGLKPGITEKKMFGGVGFMLNGNMIAGSLKSGAMLLRVGPDLHEEAVSRPGASVMHQGGKDMIGFIEVTDEGIETEEALAEWLAFAETFVATLPPK